MRIERWYWLIAFGVISAVLHLLTAFSTPEFKIKVPPVQRPNEIVVELQEPTPAVLPLPRPDPKPVVKPKPKPVVKVEPKPKPKPVDKVEPKVLPLPNAKRTARIEPKPSKDPTAKLKPVDNQQEQPNNIVKAPLVINKNLQAKPDVEPGGTEPDKLKIPVKLGSPIPRQRTEIARQKNLTPQDSQDGGGSASPSPIPGGRDGAKGPVTPSEDVLYSGGGQGGRDLPRGIAGVGGGGGNSILGVNSKNPLATPINEPRPGRGPGTGGGAGSGTGGGLGSASGPNIGVRPDGSRKVASLSDAAGPGIGKGRGDKTGTNPPGGGKGTGSETPGTGGEGEGYGRGKGDLFGDDVKIAVGKDKKDNGFRAFPFLGKFNGVPNGDANGGGGKNGGPGGSGSGGLAGTRSGGGAASGALHVVYLLDSSGSMRNFNMFSKAQEELKKALSQLKRFDTFNLINFDKEQHAFANQMLPATPENLAEAMAYIDALKMGEGTNMSSAFDAAFVLRNVTHIFLLSDGEPYGGITDFGELRQFIRQRNTQRARIITMALGGGEAFKGMELMKGIAQDNDGAFSYINLAK